MFNFILQEIFGALTITVSVLWYEIFYLDIISLTVPCQTGHAAAVAGGGVHGPHPGQGRVQQGQAGREQGVVGSLPIYTEMWHVLPQYWRQVRSLII